MQGKSLRFFVSLILIFTQQLLFAYEKESDGIVLKLKKATATDAGLIKIQVCGENIIRVIAAPGEAFSERPSLIVERQSWPEVKWSATEAGDFVTVSTDKLQVKVNKTTGAVAFHDATGKLILHEKAEAGKIISPAEVLGEQTFHIQQQFESPADEAFYGLGQHQNDVMNYKGHDVDLFQHNIVAVVPFLVSGKNYGILWDNTSRTKFGDPRVYQPLSILRLYDKEGNQGGLTVEYFSGRNFGNLLTTQQETGIAHEFVDELGTFPEGFDRNRGSIRWSGEIESDETGVHKFKFYGSEYTKVWLDGKLVVDAWRQNWLPWTHKLNLEMQAGKRYPLKIEWVANGGYIGLTALKPAQQDFGKTLSLSSEVGDQIDYYFVYGENADQVISGYRTLTGKAPMMPKWAMGFWQCRERYRTQQELLGVVREYRKRQIPLDNIVQDWFYWEEDKWGSHEFDKTRFPDPAGMVATLHDSLHARIMISVWPKFYVGAEHYNEFLEKNWLYMHNINKGSRDWVGPGYVSTFYDVFAAGARDLFWEQINEHLFSKGFDAWWLDATEPDLESNVSDSERVLRVNPNALGTAARYENAYSLMNAKGIYESQRKTRPNQRVFILTRSAYAGQQRYSAATWSGDVASRWYDLDAQISAGLNMCLSGIPYWTHDIGGFALERRYQNAQGEDLDEWRELNTRWFQFGAFTPLFRSHGQFPPREIFNIAPVDHPAYQSMVKYTKLRYRLMPYIYSLTGMVTHEDYTIMRALIMDFGKDKNVLNIGDQYMFGPALLVNPVTTYQARTRKVYLPAGTGWYDFESGKHFEGGQTIDALAPFTEAPIFVREGAILPFGPAIQYSDEKPADPIRLYVYTGQNGAFSLYEDENVNYNYENGAFSWIPFSYDEVSQTLKIGKRRGEFPGMLTERTFEIVWVSKAQPVALDLAADAPERVRYSGAEIAIKKK